MDYLSQFNAFGDLRGNLLSLEGGKNIPFDINRVFFIYDVPLGCTRGGHAHRKSKQFILCLNGGFNLEIKDRLRSTNYQLSSPNTGVYVPPLSWTNLSNFLPSTIAVVLSDSHFDKSDYIYSFEDLLNENLYKDNNDKY